MKKHTDVVQDREGNVVVGGEIYVRKQSDNSLVQLYSDDGITTTANPTTTNSDGTYSFWTANNTLKLQVWIDGVQENEETHVQHFDLDAITPWGFSFLESATAAEALTDLGVSAFVQTLLDDADAAAARGTLGLVIGTNVQAQDAFLQDIADLTLTGEAGNALIVNATEDGFELGTAPSGAGGGLVYLGTHTLSAVASVDVEDFAGLSNKGKVIIELENITLSVDGGGMSILFKLNGTYQSGAGSYKWSRLAMWSATTPDNTGSNADSSFPIVAAGAGAIGNASGEGISATIELLNPYDTVGIKRAFHKSSHIDDQATPRLCYSHGDVAYYGTDYANALGGVRLSASSGTMSGRIHVYALATA